MISRERETPQKGSPATTDNEPQSQNSLFTEYISFTSSLNQLDAAILDLRPLI